MSQQQEYWFAARTRKDQELTTRDALEKIGVEYFLPTQFVIRQLKYRRRRVEVPVIRNLIFVHATKEFACAIANEYGVRLFYMRDFDTKSMLIVPDKQMKDFMFVMNLDPAAVILNDDCSQLAPKYKSSREIFVELKVNWPVFLIVLMSLSEFVAFYLPVSRFLKATFAFSHRNQ